MKKIKLTIEGMHCTSCVMLIEGDLEDCTGVKNATCNYAKGECLAEVDDAVDTNEIKKIITNDGYTVQAMEEI